MVRSGSRTRTGSTILIAVAAVLLLPLLRTGVAADDASGWLVVPPTVTKVSDYTSLPALANDNCQPTTMQVVHGVTPQPEQRCVLATPYGNFDIDSQTLQPTGYAQAYQLDKLLGGNATLRPLPGRPESLIIRGASTNGAGLGLYRDMFAHLHFEYAPNFATGGVYAHYLLSDQPDQSLRYADGTALQINPFTLATSANGSYVLVDTIYNGFALVDVGDFSMRPVLPSVFNDPSNGHLFAAATAVTDDGSFAAVAYNAPGGWGGEKYLTLSDVHSCTGGFAAKSTDKPAYSCRTVNLYPYLQSAIPGLEAVTYIQFANDRAMTIAASYRDAAGVLHYAQYLLAVAGSPLSAIGYEALGDSYTSGEGAYSYRAGTDTGRNRCHQSLLSYPYLLGRSFDSFASVACSGARLHNVVSLDGGNVYQIYGTPSDQEKQLAQQGHVPGYLAQKSFVDRDNPQAITVSVGGNDIGFGDILAKCVHPLQKLSDIAQKVSSVETCYASYEDRLEVVNTINTQFARWRDLYKSLRAGPNGTRRVYVIGYPQIAQVGGACTPNVQMNSDEISFAHDLIAYLDSVVARAAAEAGVRYVDIQHALDGHLLCQAPAGESAVNGFTVDKSDALGYNFTPSFHPTALGQQMIAASIASQTHDETDPMPAAQPESASLVVSPDVPLLQHVPHTNRALRIIRPALDIEFNTLSTQVPFKIAAAARDFLLGAGHAYQLVLTSQPITLATATADANGNVAFNTSLPAGTPPGIHTLHIYGNDVFGNALDIQQVVYVTAGADDVDGDGIPNEQDSCVLAVQSGEDDDHNGVDDACSSGDGGPGPPSGIASIMWYAPAVLPIAINAGR